MTNEIGPFFSIIIPTYNSGKVLASCLDSVLSQKCQDYEVVVVDGVSQDATLAIVESYKEQFSSLVFIREHDQGIYDAMNKGIKQSKGKWLYFLGSDDQLYDVDVLKTVSNFIDKSEYDVVYGDVYSALHQGRYAGVFNYEDLTRQNICHQAIFFKRNVFEITGLFELKYKSASDWDHNIKWFLSSKISHGYMNIVVAYFSEGGFSEGHNDYLFDKAKNVKFLKAGYLKLPFPTLKRLCEWEIKKAKDKGAYFLLFFLEGYHLSLRLRRKFKLFPESV